MKKFAKAALNKNVEAFVIYVTLFSLNLISIYLVKKTHITLLFAKKVKNFD